MSEIVLHGKKYVSSKQAASACGYAQDYVGQLARGGVIEAERVGGHWYVSMESLEAYKQNADNFVPKLPDRSTAPSDPDTIVNFDGQDYISAARASKITGYNPDYIGQLARGGKVLSRQIGNRWYVERAGLVAHKNQKDSLLAAVQVESVGLQRPQDALGDTRVSKPTSEPYLKYFHEEADLMPELKKLALAEEKRDEIAVPATQTLSIRRVPSPVRAPQPAKSAVRRSATTSRRPRIALGTATKAVAALTVVIVVSYGLVTIKSESVYASAPSASNSMLAGAATALSTLGDMIERFVSSELRYSRE